MTRLIPKVFFNHLGEGLDLFVDCLGFKVLHQDESLAVVARDGAKAHVVESPEFAAKDRPASGNAPSEQQSHRQKTVGRARICRS